MDALAIRLECRRLARDRRSGRLTGAPPGGVSALGLRSLGDPGRRSAEMVFRYAAGLAAWLPDRVVMRDPTASGFVVLAPRWVAERGFGWLSH